MGALAVATNYDYDFAVANVESLREEALNASEVALERSRKCSLELDDPMENLGQNLPTGLDYVSSVVKARGIILSSMPFFDNSSYIVINRQWRQGATRDAKKVLHKLT